MAFFKKLFNKDDGKSPKGFIPVVMLSLDKLTADTVKVTLDIPAEIKAHFAFKPGQYLNFSISIDGKEQRRSYSICSGPNEPLAVAVKEVENGLVSKWFNRTAQAGESILVSKPEGNFVLPEDAKTVVAIGAGSGITPIMSIAKDIESSDKKMQLFFGNRTIDTILFKSEIDALSNTSCAYYLSDETQDGYESGRFDKETFTEIIKANLDLLKSDCFFICGPEPMIVSVAEVLNTFGVSKDKVNYELFTTPVLLKNEEKSESGNFSGNSSVTVLLDGEKVSFDLASDGASVLEKANDAGMDAPYSCKGGVCSTCKAKVLKGKASMTMNFSLTDTDIEEGYVLTCQAHPASSELVISYDE